MPRSREFWPRIGPVSNPIGFTDTDVLEDRRTVPTDAGDHERFAHYAPKDKVTEAMESGVNEYIVKPFTADTLTKTLKKVLPLRV